MNAPSFNIVRIAVQWVPFIHVILACIATAVILRKRREMSSALAILASLVAWLVPLFGPSAVLLGLRRPPVAQP